MKDRQFSFYIINSSLKRYLGGYSSGVPPLPIPNREVKPTRADGTALHRGRVGRRRFSETSKINIFGVSLFYIVNGLQSTVYSQQSTVGLRCFSSRSFFFSHGMHGMHGNLSLYDSLSPTDYTDLKDFLPFLFNDSLVLGFA